MNIGIVTRSLILFFEAHFGEEVSPNTRLIDEFIIDSMGFGELLAFLAETYGMDFEEDDLSVDNFQTVTSIAGLVLTKLSQMGGQDDNTSV